MPVDGCWGQRLAEKLVQGLFSRHLFICYGLLKAADHETRKLSYTTTKRLTREWTWPKTSGSLHITFSSYKLQPTSILLIAGPQPWFTAGSPRRAAKCVGHGASRSVRLLMFQSRLPYLHTVEAKVLTPSVNSVRRDQADMQPVHQSTPRMPRLQGRVRPRPTQREPRSQTTSPQTQHPTTKVEQRGSPEAG